MATEFLHGPEVLEIDNGIRTIRIASSSVIGLVGTAPDADATAFPLNTPVLIAGSRTEAAKLDTLGNGAGTLPTALDAVFDQTNAVVVVVRVDEGENETATMANVLGGVNANNGEYEGIQAFLGAKSKLGVAPRILACPGFTHQRQQNAVTAVSVTNGGSGYTSAPAVALTGGNGTGATATAEIDASGKVTKVIVTNPGTGYTAAPTVAFTGGGGSGAAATASYGSTANPVVANLVTIANKLRAVIWADGPNTTDSDAIAYRGDFGSKRVIVIDPKSITTDSQGNNQTEWSSARAAGVMAATDESIGWWASPSNKLINGIIGTSRPIDHVLGDTSSRANLLNRSEVVTIVNEDGYRLWGNRTCSDDQKWAMIGAVRTNDIIADSVMQNHLWAIDRVVDKNYIDDVVGGVNAFLRELKSTGAIAGGECWFDKELNTKENLAAGHIYFDYAFSPSPTAERITFRAHMTNDYIAEIFK